MMGESDGILGAKPARRAWRMLAALAAWGMTLAVAVAGFSAGSTRVGESLAFADQFALGSAVAVVVTLGIGGGWRRGVEAGAVGLVAILAAAGLVLVLVLILVATRTWLGAVHQLYQNAWILATFVARPALMIGAILGGASGAAAGGLIVLGRRRPGLARALALGLLLALGATVEPVSRFVTDRVVEARLNGGYTKAASVSNEEIASAIGATSGAIVGALGACVGLRAAFRPR